jgi:hypothetical protein
MGESRLGDLMPWLQESVKADSSSSERSGAAQALSEVLNNRAMFTCAHKLLLDTATLVCTGNR